MKTGYTVYILKMEKTRVDVLPLLEYIILHWSKTLEMTCSYNLVLNCHKSKHFLRESYWT